MGTALAPSLTLLLVVALSSCVSPRASASAAPGSCDYQVGWTSHVQGGLGGEVIKVTSLAASGPGSLREALETPGPRVVVFEVGGVIDLATNSLGIVEPYLTVAGQTAPSPGIMIIRGTLGIHTHDVVVQHLAVRPGDAGQGVGWEPDGITLGSAHDVIIDHCSVSWAVDENLTASGPRFEGATPDDWRENTSRRVTFSHNIVAEALSNATHAEGEHSKGSLIHDNVTDVLVYRNLYTSNVDRSPMFKGGARGAIVNNYVVNPGLIAMSYFLVPDEWTGMTHQVGRMSVVGNVLDQGLDTSAANPLVFAFGLLEIHLDDNAASSLSGDPVNLLSTIGTEVTEVAAPPAWPAGLDVAASGDVVALLAGDVGARPWDRSPIDARIVSEALAGTTRHIDSQDDVGGYPLVAPPTLAPFDPSEWDDCYSFVPEPGLESCGIVALAVLAAGARRRKFSSDTKKGRTRIA